MDTTFTIKLRTSDNKQHEMQVTSDTSVHQLKGQIKQCLNIQKSKQRLICQGKILQDEFLMSQYKIEQGHVIQLTINDRNKQEGHALQEQQGLSTQENLNDILGFGLNFSPQALLTRRRRRYHRRRELTQCEKLEAINQNIQTIQNLLASNQSETRNFQIGQWIDVRDTVDQWLEAQILDIRNSPQGTVAYIHYNGWPQRWDEWIDINSPRIQPIRTYTIQAITSPMHSPFPVISPDGDGPTRENSEFKNFAKNSEEIMQKLLSSLEIYQNLRQAQQINELDEESELELKALKLKIAPLLDRSGRLVTDLGGMIQQFSSSEAFMDDGQDGEQVRIPVMPSHSDLATRGPRNIGSDVDIHIHAIFSQRRDQVVQGNQEQERRMPCWRQIS